jgi:hypothetical protein
LTEEIRDHGHIFGLTRQFFNKTDGHHGFSLACASFDPQERYIFPIIPTVVLFIVENPLDQLVQQLVLVLFQSILDYQ